MMIDVILAAGELPQEPDLVAAATASGVRIVRRCVDAVDLLAAAAIDTDIVVVVSAGLPRLSADVTSRLGSKRRIVGLAEDPLDATALDGLGVRTVMPVGAVAEDTWRSVRSAVLTLESSGRSDGAAGVWTTGLWSEAGGTERSRPGDAAGAIIAVWGPMGAPGRTTVAIGLAEAIAADGRRVCLVDADTYAPSIGLTLGMVDDAGGLLRACRQADNGLLDSTSIVASTRLIRGQWHVLTGLPSAERWAALSSSALDAVWQSARAAFDVTVVDIGFCVEDDESPAAWACRRNCAAVTALAAADHVVAVADASALGAARLVAAFPSLRSASGSPATVVRNRSDGRRAAADWDDALRACGLDASVHALPIDSKSLAACWSRGRSLGEGARRSPLRRSLNGLAKVLVSG